MVGSLTSTFGWRFFLTEFIGTCCSFKGSDHVWQHWPCLYFRSTARIIVLCQFSEKGWKITFFSFFFFPQSQPHKWTVNVCLFVCLSFVCQCVQGAAELFNIIIIWVLCFSCDCHSSFQTKNATQHQFLWHVSRLARWSRLYRYHTGEIELVVLLELLATVPAIVRSSHN